ncbi:MAG: hypothetical protein K0S75_3079, partial [Clostridia bacterium]|nr:hypothetical protein [Clostridia bacterium]
FASVIWEYINKEINNIGVKETGKR